MNPSGGQIKGWSLRHWLITSTGSESLHITGKRSRIIGGMQANVPDYEFPELTPLNDTEFAADTPSERPMFTLIAA